MTHICQRLARWTRASAAAILFLANLSARSQDVSAQQELGTPERKVEGNAIISNRDPEVRIELPQSIQYVGADRFVLLGIADCELHVFVKPDAQHVVQRLYWIQFEQYLPSKPELHHQYDSPRHATIDGLDFYVDTFVDASDKKVTPGSDTEHIRALIARTGYKLPAAVMGVRFVHLLDPAKRKELMIIYGEDLGPTGFSAADLSKGGKALERWPMIEEELIERAKSAILINQ